MHRKFEGSFKKMNFELQKDDIRYIVGNGLFPDACIVIYCEEKDVIKRNLPGRLTHYKEYNKLGFQLISLSKKFSLILLVSTRY